MVTRQTSDNMVLQIPANTIVKLEGDLVKITQGPEEISVKFNTKKVSVVVSGNTVTIKPIKKLRRETNALIQSVCKHILNVFKGGTTPYQKKMQVVYAHFPISIEVKGKAINIKNFLGEKVPREAEIIGNTQVLVAGQDITVKGPDIDAVGQTVANIIQSVRIVGKDRRVFQDGIYIVK